MNHWLKNGIQSARRGRATDGRRAFFPLRKRADRVGQGKETSSGGKRRKNRERGTNHNISQRNSSGTAKRILQKGGRHNLATSADLLEMMRRQKKEKGAVPPRAFS